MEKNIIQEVKEAYKEELRKILAQEYINFNEAKRDVIEAEGRMVTRYDSTKTEVAWLANSRLAEIKVIEKEIERVDIKDKINIGDKVTVRVPYPNGEIVTEVYYIGTKNQNELDIPVKYIDSPEGKALLGHLKEDIVEVEEKTGSRTLQVIDINSKPREDEVLVNSVIKIEDEEFGEEYYYITESRGGIFLELSNEVEVTVVTTKSPLALTLLGKGKGDKCELTIGDSKRELCILDIINE